jgi:hypothetical protein
MPGLSLFLEVQMDISDDDIAKINARREAFRGGQGRTEFEIEETGEELLLWTAVVAFLVGLVCLCFI